MVKYRFYIKYSDLDGNVPSIVIEGENKESVFEIIKEIGVRSENIAKYEEI